MADSENQETTSGKRKTPLAHDLKQIIDLVRNSDITELHIEDGDRKFSLKRGPAAHDVKRTHVEEVHIHTEEEVPEHLITITAPMVGTFYQSTGPNEPPMVREGERIAKGQIVGVIEAMKMMNEIESEHGGTIVKILASNGQPVEYGHPLMLLEPEG
ncbi:MAG: acetyl-CoA carboxylase, biotin carboxyl carrier protein [Chloroflexi bacterium]|nr:acetyl-CoA carboxylase, biotin carboxyl carrier protein [Chloroflexota bacterium]